jgi:phage portal protein BeeE
MSMKDPAAAPLDEPGMAADRAALWDRVSNAAFLTLNEKREAVGYGPVAGGDRWG